jgi:cytochrome bd-type quinol oxidase subunit 2
MTLLTLYLLASLDGLLCGCRTAMGRCPLIHLRPYYARALVRGFVAAQIASALALSALSVVFLLTPHRSELQSDLESAARRMLWIFLPYAAAVLSALGLRLVPSTDTRSASSVFFLGPLTAIRPFLMFAGVLFGIYNARLWETRLLGLIVLTLMLSVEAILNRQASRHQSRQISSLV